jgi:hypothetical protein
MGEFVKVATIGVIAPGEGKLVDASTSTGRSMRLTRPVPTEAGPSPRECLWAKK